MVRPTQLDMWDRDTLAQPMRASCGPEALTFSDRMVVARSRHHCTECEGEIETGDRVRARVELDPTDPDKRTVRTLYACAPCCAAMADRTVREEAL